MNRLSLRVVSLEEDVPHVRQRISHEDALAALGADPRPLPDLADFSDAELDAEWTRLVAEWGETP